MPRRSKTKPIVIRSYARSRLYDAAGERHVSLDMLRLWPDQAIAFTVLDVETGQDVTHVLLA
jgi:polyhydroxyalkanoate synthesis regulator protein